MPLIKFAIHWTMLAATFAQSTIADAIEDDRTKRTDSYLASLVGIHEPGIALGVWGGGRALYRGTRGMADIEQGTLLTASSVFHLASLSKEFTGLAVLKLVARGRIDLKSDIHRYLPELPDYGALIRVEHLLHMTSGLKDQWALMRLAGRDWRDLLTQEMLISAVKRVRELDFQPGSAFAYSNTNYLLLAEIVARVSGQSFRETLESEVFAPLGMHSSFVYDDVSEPVPRRANSYYLLPEKSGWHRMLLAYQNYGATSVQSTLDDMLRWGCALKTQRLEKVPFYLAIAQPARLLNGTPIFYGAGLYQSRALGHDTVEHEGSDASFRTAIRYFPHDDVGIIVLANRELDAGKVANEVARLWLAEVDEQEKPIDASVLSRDLPGVYAGGRTDAAIRIDLRAEGLAMRVANEGDRVLRVTGPGELSIAGADVDLRVVRDESGRVTGLEEHNATNPRAPYIVMLRRLNPPIKINPEEYLGTYRNADLDATYRVAFEHGALMLRHIISSPAFEMEPTDRDRFELWDYAFRTVKFVREGQSVVALSISGDRATNVRFVRQIANERPDSTETKNGN